MESKLSLRENTATFHGMTRTELSAAVRRLTVQASAITDAWLHGGHSDEEWREREDTMLLEASAIQRTLAAMTSMIVNDRAREGR